MKAGTCKKIRSSCLCRSTSGKVAFKKGGCKSSRKRASSGARCKIVKGGRCLCKTPQGGYTFAKKSRCK